MYDDFFKTLTKTPQNFGDYSPRSGFENEDELLKNPYQQILSSQPKSQTDNLSDMLGMGNSNSQGLSGMLTNPQDPFSNFEPSAQNFTGEINQDFWNRKDIYDTKQRLQASGIDIPEQGQKEKPNFLIRALNKLGMLGYGMTTGLYNVADDNKDTTFLQGVGQGLKAGWKNTGEEKLFSDVLEVMDKSDNTGKQMLSAILNPIGELGEAMQSSDNKLINSIGKGTEWTGDFISGLAGDIVSDPLSYVSLGGSTLLRKGGQEVAEATVKKSIDDIAKAGLKISDDLTKSGASITKTYDPVQEAQRITKRLNEARGTNLKGLGLEIPFTNIRKEFVSGENLNKFGDMIGTTNTADALKNIWNTNKSDNGIRSVLEKIPESIGKKFDSQYDLKKLAKSDPEKFAQTLATDEVVRNIMFNGKEEFEKNVLKGLDLDNMMKELNIDRNTASNLMESFQRYKPTEDLVGMAKEFDLKNEAKVKYNTSDMELEYNKILDQLDNTYDEQTKQGLLRKKEAIERAKATQNAPIEPVSAPKTPSNPIDEILYEDTTMPPQDIIGDIMNTSDDVIQYGDDTIENKIMNILNRDIDNANKTKQVLVNQKDVSVKPSDMLDSNSDLKGIVTNKDYLGKNALDIARMKPEEMDWFLDEIANSGIDAKKYDELIDAIDKIQEGMIDDSYIDPLKGAYQSAPKTTTGINADNIDEVIADLSKAHKPKLIDNIAEKYNISKDSVKELKDLLDSNGLFNEPKLSRYSMRQRKELLDSSVGYKQQPKKPVTNKSFIKEEMERASGLFFDEFDSTGKKIMPKDFENKVKSVVERGKGFEDLHDDLLGQIKKIIGDNDLSKMNRFEHDLLRKEIRDIIDDTVYSNRGMNGVAKSELDDILKKQDFSGDAFDVEGRVNSSNDKSTMGKKLQSLIEEEQVLKSNNIPVPEKLTKEIKELSDIVDNNSFFSKMFKDLKGTSYDNVKQMDTEALIRQTLDEPKPNIPNEVKNVVEDVVEPNKAIPEAKKKGFEIDYDKTYTPDELATAKNTDLTKMLKELGIEGRSKLKTKQAKIDALDNFLNPENAVSKTKDTVRKELEGLQGNKEGMISKLKELGIEDTKNLEDLYDKHGKLMNEKKAIEHFKNTGDTESFKKAMKDINGDNFEVAFSNAWSRHMDRNYSELAPLSKEEFWNSEHNKNVLKEIGIEDSEDMRKFVDDYFDYMDNLAKTEQDWKLLKEGQVVKNMGYVPHKVRRDVLDKLSDADKTNIQRALDNLANFGDKKFGAGQTRTKGKMTIQQFNEYIAKETKVQNYFETDLSRLIVQRTWEHSDAFMNKKTQELYLDTLGTKLDWYTSNEGNLSNIIEGNMPLREVQANIGKAIKDGDFSRVFDDVMAWKPNKGLANPDYVQKAKDDWLQSYNEFTEYKETLEHYKTLNIGQEKIENMEKKLERLQRKLHSDLPQRGYMRQLQNDIDSGKVVLVYPEGQTATKKVNAITDDVVEKTNDASMYNEIQELSTLTWDDFEKLQLEDKRVPVSAISKEMYDQYTKHTAVQVKQDTGAFLKIYDKATEIWKRMAIATPGFVGRNAQGNYFKNYFDIGFKAFDPTYTKYAQDVLGGTDKVIGKTGMTGTDIKDLARKYGVLNDTQVQSELMGVAKNRTTLDDALAKLDGTYKRTGLGGAYDKTLGKYEKGLQKANDIVEKNSRLHNIIVHLEEGMNFQEAVEQSNKFLFDYGDLTDFEKNVMRRLMPFYTYNKKNFVLQLDQLATNTKQYNNLYKGLKNMNNHLSDEEKSMLDPEEKIMLAGAKREDGSRRMINSNTGWLETSSPLSMLNPLVKTPLELATNKNFSFNNDIAQFDGQVNEARTLEGLLGSLLGATTKGEDGKKYIDAKTQHAITNALPSMRFADKTINDFTNKRPEDAIMNLIGVNGGDFDYDKRVSAELRDYLELLKNEESNAYRKGTDVRGNYYSYKDEQNNSDYLELLKMLGIK